MIFLLTASGSSTRVGQPNQSGVYRENHIPGSGDCHATACRDSTRPAFPCASRPPVGFEVVPCAVPPHGTGARLLPPAHAAPPHISFKGHML